MTNIPLKTNFIIAGYAYASGNIMLDAALPIENFNGKIHTMVFAYARAINFFGKSGKIDISLPFGGDDWKGTFEDKYFEDHSLKFTAVSGIRFEQGGDFDAFGVAYQYRWNKQSK